MKKAPPLTTENIHSALTAKHSGLPVFVYALTDSTNLRALEYARESGAECDSAVFIAEAQTKGRGRLGRSFYSPSQSGLYASLLFPAPSSADRTLSLTALAAVAAFEEIRERFGITLGIKWVNDLYLGGKKVAGILAESFPHEKNRYIVLGIGINLSTDTFPDELLQKAGSLGLDRIDAAARRELAQGIFSRLLDLLDSDDVSGAMQTYREHSIVIGKQIGFTRDDKEMIATALEITDDGALLVELDKGGQLLISTGEISIFLNPKS